jgi:valine--pyruvate aminotransferase
MIYTEATPFWDDNTILCLSLSKFGLPGVRTGIVVGPPEVTKLISNANAINGLAPARTGP